MWNAFSNLINSFGGNMQGWGNMLGNIGGDIFNGILGKGGTGNTPVVDVAGDAATEAATDAVTNNNGLIGGIFGQFMNNPIENLGTIGQIYLMNEALKEGKSQNELVKEMMNWNRQFAERQYGDQQRFAGAQLADRQRGLNNTVTRDANGNPVYGTSPYYRDPNAVKQEYIG